MQVQINLCIWPVCVPYFYINLQLDRHQETAFWQQRSGQSPNQLSKMWPKVCSCFNSLPIPCKMSCLFACSHHSLTWRSPWYTVTEWNWLEYNLPKWFVFHLSSPLHNGVVSAAQWPCLKRKPPWYTGYLGKWTSKLARWEAEVFRRWIFARQQWLYIYIFICIGHVHTH